MGLSTACAEQRLHSLSSVRLAGSLDCRAVLTLLNMRQPAVSPRGLVRALRGHHSSLQCRSFATPTSLPEKDCTSITPPYSQLLDNLAIVREVIGRRPLTLAEKILYSHIHEPERTLADGGIKRGETYLQLRPERVAMQDASAQMAL